MPKKEKVGVLLSSLLGEVSGNSPIASRINRYLHQRESSRPAFIPKGYHPSSLDVGTCARALVLERLGVQNPNTIEPSLARIFDNGTAVGVRVQNYMVAAGILTQEQTEVPIHGAEGDKRKRYSAKMLKVIDAAAKRAAPFEFRGHMDGFDPFHEDGPVVYEIKGMNSFTHNKLTAPIPKHVTQASIYADAAGAKRIVFYYECKDNQQPKEFAISPDKSRVDAVKAIVKVAKKALTVNALPARDVECPHARSPKALKCPFVAACFGAKNFKALDRRNELTPRDYR